MQTVECRLITISTIFDWSIFRTEGFSVLSIDQSKIKATCKVCKGTMFFYCEANFLDLCDFYRILKIIEKRNTFVFLFKTKYFFLYMYI